MMPRSKTSNEDGEEMTFPNLSRTTPAISTPNLDKPSGALPLLGTNPTLATTSSSASAIDTTHHSNLDATPNGPVKFASRLRKEVSPLGRRVKHIHAATPTSSVKPGSSAHKSWAYDPGSDDEDDNGEDALSGTAKPGSRLPDMGLKGRDYRRESGGIEPVNPGNKIHDKWATISVHTAKCDKCGGHNRKVVQRCQSCNIQFCRDCLEKNDDKLHVADIEALDWTPKQMLRSKRKPATTGKASGSKTNPKAPAAQNKKTPSRASSRITKGKGYAEQLDTDNEDFMGEQEFDEEEYVEDPPRKSKRNYPDSVDEDEGVPKKSRLGNPRQPMYQHAGYGDYEGHEVEDNGRHDREGYRPKGPRDVGDFRRPSYGYGRGNNGLESAAYESSTNARRGSSGYPAPARPLVQPARAPRMTYEEAIEAAWEHQQEKKRQAAAAEEEARQREREVAASKNPKVLQLLKEGRKAEAEELLQMANTLMELRRNE